MEVDSFKYLSRLVTRYYKLAQVSSEPAIPWTPLKKPLNQSRFGLVTSGGLYPKGQSPPFDIERERREPSWGDPSYRTLPSNIDQSEVEVSHLHINKKNILKDMNILLPVQRFQEMAEDGRIHSLAEHVYSFMGYQGFPADLTGWKEIYGPEVTEKLLADHVDCVLLTTA